MKRIFLLVFCLLSLVSFSQKKFSAPKPSQPKLVVGIVIDQMRWDYLQRFKPLFKSNGGFKKLLNGGFSCNNTMVPYTPTVTACGHTCIYTGSVPNIHGIAGNDWYDNILHKKIYCTQDDTIVGIGNVNEKDKEGKMSPRNLLVTTITDELKLATNFKSKVIGISLKDRGSILPAGHSANAAYWYNKNSGNFISSNYYMQQLPAWASNFNTKKMVDSFYNLGWQLSLSNNVYLQYCSKDEEIYEDKLFGKAQPTFPYNLSQFINKDYEKIMTTPFGNVLTTTFAKAAIINENLGKNAVLDFLTISYSSPDKVGHSFGPNSWELLDCYIKLDEELGKLLNFLDEQIGANNYLCFLTADHAIGHSPEFLQQHNLPGGKLDVVQLKDTLNKQLQTIYGVSKLVKAIYNEQISFDISELEKNKLDKLSVYNTVINFLNQLAQIDKAFIIKDALTLPLTQTIREMVVNGFYEQRSGQIQFIFKPGYIDGWIGSAAEHSVWNTYDAHIPLLFYGHGIKKGNTYRQTYMTDIAATLAALLNIQMPSGCIGKVIEEVMEK